MKSVVVTGSTSGIGLAIASAFAESGANVVINGFGAADEIEAIRAKLDGLGAGRVLGRDVPLTRYRVHSLRPLANFDLAAARTKLGWTPRVGVRRGLDLTFGP